MSDHDGYCRCPLLRWAAEVERMAALGIEVDTHLQAAPHIVVGILRDKYGCRGPVQTGPQAGRCRWEAPFGAPHLTLGFSRDVPEVKPRKDRSGEPGVFL